MSEANNEFEKARVAVRAARVNLSKKEFALRDARSLLKIATREEGAAREALEEAEGELLSIARSEPV